MQIIDMHCDTISRLLANEEKGETSSLKENDGHLDLIGMKKGDYLLQNFAMFTPLKSVDDPLVYVLKMIDKYKRELAANSDLILPVYSYRDIEENCAKGKMSALLTLEEGAVVHNDLALLRIMYDLGVRMITLTWNYQNGIGHPNIDYTLNDDRKTMLRHVNDRDGLTDFGIAYVKEMERLGIIVDVSHLGDAGFYDVLRYTSKPFVASHSNARAICPVARNLKDDMIKAMADRGSVIGINYCDDFIAEDGNGSIAKMLEHMDHIIKIGGEDVIGLGSDFDGIATRKELSKASEMPSLIKAMQEHGYSDRLIDKITHLNVLRLYKEILH